MATKATYDKFYSRLNSPEPDPELVGIKLEKALRHSDGRRNYLLGVAETREVTEQIIAMCLNTTIEFNVRGGFGGNRFNVVITALPDEWELMKELWQEISKESK